MSPSLANNYTGTVICFKGQTVSSLASRDHHEASCPWTRATTLSTFLLLHKCPGLSVLSLPHPETCCPRWGRAHFTRDSIWNLTLTLGLLVATEELLFPDPLDRAGEHTHVHTATRIHTRIYSYSQADTICIHIRRRRSKASVSSSAQDISPGLLRSLQLCLPRPAPRPPPLPSLHLPSSSGLTPGLHTGLSSAVPC